MRSLIIITALLVVALGVGYFYTISQFKSKYTQSSNSIVFLDRLENPFYVVDDQNSRQFIPISKINRSLSMSVVALEDARFFQHFGFDLPRIFTAVVDALRSGRPTYGASTITQQLCKNTLFSPERTIKRKFLELFCAIFVEIRYSKAQILEFYLNSVYFGNGNVGVTAASLNFFNIMPEKLSLAQSAILAGLIKRPEDYLPVNNIEATRNRQLLALKRLLKLGWIDQDQFKAAAEAEVIFHETRIKKQPARYFVAALINELKQEFGPDFISAKGLRVYSTIDSVKQNELEQTVDQYFASSGASNEISAISLDNQGDIQALVGGRSFGTSQFNRATQALRQPGSALKPFIYLLALEQGYSPQSLLLDEPISYPKATDFDEEFPVEDSFYEPLNFDQEFHGIMSLAEGLRTSNNILAIKLLSIVGIDNFLDLSRRINLGVDRRAGLCLALGCVETSLLKLVNAYSIFNNGGFSCKPRLYTKVVDADGRVVLENDADCVAEVEPDDAIIIQELLHEVITRGTGRNANIPGYAAGKTGTTQNNRDAWFVGFSGDVVAGFWIGNDDNSPLNNETGGSTPARLWKNYMSSITLNSRPPELNGAWEKVTFNAFNGCPTSMDDPDKFEISMPLRPDNTKCGVEIDFNQ